MKQITIRLNDNTAEALDRLAALNEKSANRCINYLIANAYAQRYEPNAFHNGELLFMATIEQFPFTVLEKYAYNYGLTEHDRPEEKWQAVDIFKAAQYSIDKLEERLANYETDDEASEDHAEYMRITAVINKLCDLQADARRWLDEYSEK